MLHRIRDRLLGDGVEHDALDLVVLDRALFLQHFEHVPGDRFALTIGVGCEDQLVGALQRLGDIIEPASRLGIHFPDHLEIGLRIDRSVLRREIADVAERGQNLVGRSQIFVDRLGFRRRLDNDDIHVIPIAYGENNGRFRETRAGHFEPNMGAAEAPVKSTDVEGGPLDRDLVSIRL
jgi:hypothetical protein